MSPSFGRALRYTLRGPLIKALLRLFALMPLPWNHAAGAGLGRLFARYSHELRHVTDVNLGVCFPNLSDTDRAQRARDCLIETGKSMTELGPLWLWEPKRVLRLVREISGEEALRDALALGHGAIMASPHLGAWELMGLYLAAKYGITSMYRPPRIADLDETMRRARSRTGATLVPTDASGVRALLQALKRGGLVGVLPDQDPGAGGGEFSPFCGVPANTMTLLSRLAQRSGAPVIFCYAERLARGTGFHLRFEAAPKAVSAGDLAASLAAVNATVEALIRRAPEQYQWSYRRFRTRPANLSALY